MRETKKFMKFYLLAVTIAVFMGGAATAQHINVGIKGGVNLYNVYNSNDVEYDMNIGFHIGLLGHIHLAKKFAMQPEVVFSTQGAKYSFNNADAYLNLNYINVPLLFQYMFDNGFRLQAGPQIGFLINAKSKISTIDNDVKENFNAIDFGASVGMSYVHPPSGFGFDARYTIGLSDINKNGSVTSTNRGFQLGVFYLFKHKS
jgi:hypothetical protein